MTLWARLRECSEGDVASVVIGTALASSVLSAMASTIPDVRLPSCDGFPEGADITYKREVCSDTADNLFDRVIQPQPATVHTLIFLEPRKYSS